MHVKAADVVDIKERAERLEAIRAKDKRRYRGRLWDYISDQSVHSADTCQQVLSGYYDHLLAGSPKGDELEEPPSDGIPVAKIQKTDGHGGKQRPVRRPRDGDACLGAPGTPPPRRAPTLVHNDMK
eukprot:COSAG01_NODE_2022_length_8630_cov_16.836010_5_plen_126_part_00